MRGADAHIRPKRCHRPFTGFSAEMQSEEESIIMRKPTATSGYKRGRILSDSLFLLPALFAFVFVILIPFLLGIYYSFTNWDGINYAKDFIGFANYLNIFRDNQFLYSAYATIKYALFSIVLVNVVGFGLALLVTSRARGKNLYRVGFFVPNLIGGIVLGTIWQFIFSNIIPSIAQKLGIAGLETSLLSRGDLIIFIMAFVNTWQYAGYIMMIYVAGIQSISMDVIEASEVDGANYPTRIFRIVMPLVSNSFTICLFLTLTNAFKSYDLNVALTNGGPAGIFAGGIVRQSELLALNIYNTAYMYNKTAEGQAKAVIFFIFLAVISIIQVSITKKREVEL